MKLYNPFRWHIAKNCNNQYVVRKFSLVFGWRYLDRKNVAMLWSSNLMYEYCVVDSLEQAEKLLNLSRGTINNFKAI